MLLSLSLALREFRSWSTREPCEKSKLPNYDYAYEKYAGQLYESKVDIRSHLL